MSLRDRIKHVIDCVDDQDDSVCMDAAADAILALVNAHLTSDDAVERARQALHRVRWRRAKAMLNGTWKEPTDEPLMLEDARAAILAALGDTHD